jgi:hypothetical protein
MARRSKRRGNARCEAAAQKAALVLFTADGWAAFAVVEEHPHVHSFEYEVHRRVDEEEDLDAETVKIGKVSGYVISHDWTMGELDLWDECDACSGEAVAYADSIIRELRAFNQVSDPSTGLDLASMQRVLMIKHVEPELHVDSVRLVHDVVATLVLKETPKLTIVDPWPLRRADAMDRMEGRKRTAALLTLGFVRMVGSRFLWSWDIENADGIMSDYSYDRLRAAKQAGKLDGVLKRSVAEDVYGEGIAQALDLMLLPDPDSLMDE